MYLAFTGGGTGGHVVPNLAVIAELKESYPDHKILYIGSKKGIENQLINKKDIHFFQIHTGKIRRYFSFQNFIDLLKVPVGIFQAFFILKRNKPYFLFSKGGFVSFPSVVAAWALRIPIYVHESDLRPGLANKMSFYFAKKILTSFPETTKYIKNKGKIQYVGTPIRQELFKPPKKIKKPRNTKANILIMGGSQGAEQINTLIDQKIDLLTEKYNLFHIRGKNYQKTTIKNYNTYDFLGEELADIYSFADLVISRGGANSLAEIAAFNLKAIIIPLSKKVSRGDQIDNAKSYKKKYHWTILNSPNSDELFTTIETVLKEKTQDSTNKKSATQKIIKLLSHEISN